MWLELFSSRYVVSVVGVQLHIHPRFATCPNWNESCLGNEIIATWRSAPTATTHPRQRTKKPLITAHRDKKEKNRVLERVKKDGEHRWWEMLLGWSPTARGVFHSVLHPAAIWLILTWMCLLLVIVLHVWKTGTRWGNWPGSNYPRNLKVGLAIRLLFLAYGDPRVRWVPLCALAALTFCFLALWESNMHLSLLPSFPSMLFFLITPWDSDSKLCTAGWCEKRQPRLAQSLFSSTHLRYERMWNAWLKAYSISDTVWKRNVAIVLGRWWAWGTQPMSAWRGMNASDAGYITEWISLLRCAIPPLSVEAVCPRLQSWTNCSSQRSFPD